MGPATPEEFAAELAMAFWRGAATAWLDAIKAESSADDELPIEPVTSLPEFPPELPLLANTFSTTTTGRADFAPAIAVPEFAFGSLGLSADTVPEIIPPVALASDTGSETAAVLIAPSKLLLAIVTNLASLIGLGVALLPAGAFGESITRFSGPIILRRNCCELSIMPIMPGDSSWVAPPSRVAT